ncbi:hypothetical protein ABZ722_38430 [Streptomyces longwoodensis]|uniref:hypothetical protein n=1 Tax=Streptomyces longwoodensis TaxID=68231 RepID=UPI0033D878A7
MDRQDTSAADQQQRVSEGEGTMDGEQEPLGKAPEAPAPQAPAAQPRGSRESTELRAWRQHVCALVDEAFPTRRAAADAVNLRPDALSRRLNSKGNSPGEIRMPERTFVDQVLQACARQGVTVTEKVRSETRRLYMAALEVTHPARHEAYRQQDDLALMQARCEELTDLLADREARHAQESASHLEDRQRLADQVAAAEAACTAQQQQAADVIAAKEAIIMQLTAQLASERQLRLASESTVRALRGELLELRDALAQADEERGRREREEAVLAEAIAVTERALHAEPAPAAAVEPAAAAAETTSRGTALAAFVGIVLTGLGITVLGMHAAPADTGAHHAVVEAFRHSSIAPYAGVAACFLGLLVLVGSLISYVDPNGEISTADDITFATWI